MKGRILSINLGLNGSTGKIMKSLYETAKQNGFEFVYAAPASNCQDAKDSDYIQIGTRLESKLGNYISKATGLDGFFPIFATIRFLNLIKKNDVDIIHLHNLHHSYICLPLLFRYIKRNNISVVWTLHDCWSFTGHCPHFMYEKCDKWKTGCYSCPRFRDYPKSIFDNSKFMWKLKKRIFNGVNDLVLVTPSQWLGELTRHSYLQNYPVKVINNGIDLDVFKPLPSDFRSNYGLEEKKVVLGVAFDWGVKKGLDVFIELSKRLPSDYQIVLVGTDENIDKLLPNNIISIHRTHNQSELAKIYSMADVFVNPTREDTFPTVNIEALACSTPVLTFNTGGSPECIDSTCGSVVECDDIVTFEQEIIRICEQRPYSKQACFKKAAQFDKNCSYKEYVDLYERINTERNKTN